VLAVEGTTLTAAAAREPPMEFLSLGFELKGA
jgi:hypothetical protein